MAQNLVIKSRATSSSALTTCSTELIAENGWDKLIQAKQFDESKALSSLEATNREYIAKLPHKTIEDVFAVPTASLATLKKYRGEDKMLAVVIAMLVRCSEMLNVGKAMSDYQIQETAKLIFGEYYYLTLGDFRVCFNNGITGKYGQFYDRLDSSIIFHWLATYSDERVAFSEKKSQNESDQFKKLENATPAPNWFLEKIEKIAKQKRVASIPKSADVKFSTLASFLDSIGRADEESQNLILETWNTEFESLSPEIELDAWLIYKSNQLLYQVNLGKVKDWNDVLESLNTNQSNH